MVLKYDGVSFMNRTRIYVLFIIIILAAFVAYLSSYNNIKLLIQNVTQEVTQNDTEGSSVSLVMSIIGVIFTCSAIYLNIANKDCIGSIDYKYDENLAKVYPRYLICKPFKSKDYGIDILLQNNFVEEILSAWIPVLVYFCVIAPFIVKWQILSEHIEACIINFIPFFYFLLLTSSLMFAFLTASRKTILMKLRCMPDTITDDYIDKNAKIDGLTFDSNSNICFKDCSINTVIYNSNDGTKH